MTLTLNLPVHIHTCRSLGPYYLSRGIMGKAVSWVMEGAKERHWKGVLVNCYKWGIYGSEDGGPSTLTWQPAAQLDEDIFKSLVMKVLIPKKWSRDVSVNRRKRLTVIAQRDVREKWKSGDFVQCFWSRLAGYPNLRLYLDPVIKSLLVLCKLQLDLAFLLVLHGGFLKKNELEGNIFNNVSHISDCYITVHSLINKTLRCWAGHSFECDLDTPLSRCIPADGLQSLYNTYTLISHLYAMLQVPFCSWC